MAVGQIKALRGRVLTFTADPDDVGLEACHRYIEDGLVVVKEGLISEVGEASALLPSLPTGTAVDHYAHELIMPGFIDTHIHFPQTRVIGSYGAQLLEWLQKYTFVEEQKYRDPAHAAAGAKFFFDEVLRNGTTTAVAYCSVHPESVEAFFTESERRGTRMIAGKVMMDRNAPEALRDTPQSGYDQTKALLKKWDNRGRQNYVISPRFAITSTEEQMEMSQALVREHPEAYVQTHLCENVNEIAYVKTLYPNLKSYTGIYEHYGILGPKSIFGHCVHLEDEEVEALSGTGSIAAFCPTSNLFLGSGLFNMKRLKNGRRPVKVSIATDVGGGTSYSMLQTAAEAYKILQLQGQSWPALAAFHMMTRGNAQTLGLADKIGTLERGREADIIVLDANATPSMKHRMESVQGDLQEELFILMMMGDDRNVKATYVAGNKV